MPGAHQPVPSLGELQRWFAARVLPTGVATGLADARCELDQWLAVPTRSVLAERLSVYRDGYPARIAEALDEAYPAVAAVLGEQVFAAVVGRYVETVALTAYNLNDAGAGLAAFLRTEVLSETLPFLADLAVLEWHVTRAFHAHDTPPLEPRTLPWTAEDWAGATLGFQPSVAVVWSRWPLFALWSAPTRARELLCDQPDHVLVCRRGTTVRCESVCADEARTLRLLLEGRTLAEAIAHVPGTGAQTVSAWFSRWIASGMVAGANRAAE